MTTDTAEIAVRLKKMIIERLNLKITEKDIGDTQPLFGGEKGSLNLDSIEALEIAVGIESEFDVRVDEGEEAVGHFYSVATLSKYVHDLLEQKAAGA